ncbi:ATP-binding protein [Streptomyces dysideae]|uniref:ATP-binding protein n=1 Tax=Streptomyces dysideae TaxID=909626 RepID=UPI000ADFA31D|nr:ATP-binding protein [Streptomyces dysideae]
MPEPQPPTTPDPAPVLHEDLLDYTPVLRSVPLARRRAARLVAEWGYAALAGDVALVVSELMTNALLHGSLRDRLIRVRLTATATVLSAEVSDPRGERVPCPRDAGARNSSGGGWHWSGRSRTTGAYDPVSASARRSGRSGNSRRPSASSIRRCVQRRDRNGASVGMSRNGARRAEGAADDHAV